VRCVKVLVYITISDIFENDVKNDIGIYRAVFTHGGPRAANFQGRNIKKNRD
jgi:hypothetical protein